MAGTNGNLPSEDADVCIIGGGPAGATTGTLLKQALPSARVVLCERAQFPRHHIGESLLPNANPVLAKMGVVDRLDQAGFQRKGGVTVKLREGHPMIREWFVSEAERHLHGTEPRVIPHHAWQVERSRYDQILLEHAAGSGVEVLQPASVVDVLRDGLRVSGLVVDHGGERRKLSTRFVVDCSGQGRFLGRALGLDLIEHDLGDLAIYRYYDGADWSEDLLGWKDYSKVFFAIAPPVGWIWYIVLSTTLVSVGVVTRKNIVAGRDVDEVFDETLSRVPEMASLLRSARRVPAACDTEVKTRTHTAANWSYAHSRAAGPGWYLAGDAAAFVDPVLSSGVMLAHYAGLWVANAIVTELKHREIDQTDLHRAYRGVYEDARDGFGDMASWWYSQSDKKMDETWVEHGAKLMRSRQARGAEGLSDVSAFMSLVAGQLTDFRFRFVGTGGFEPKGLADVGGGSYDKNLVKEVFCLVDPTCRVERNWDRCERDWYLGTYVEASCWWRLPMLRFYRDGVMTEYRPAVHFLPCGDPDIERSVWLLDALLAAFQTADLVGDVEWEIRRRERDGRSDPALTPLVEEMIRDLIRLDLVRTGEPGGVLRKEASRRFDVRDVLAPAYDRAEVNLIDIGSFGSEPTRLAVWTFVFSDRSLRYSPLHAQLPAMEALLKACDLGRPAEDLVANAERELEDRHTESATVRDLLAQLVDLGVFEVVAGPSDGQRDFSSPSSPLPPDAEAALAAGVARATGGAWQLGPTHCQNGRISAQMSTPEGPLTLEIALASDGVKAYKTLKGVSYSYQKDDAGASPSARVLKDLDRVIEGLELAIPPALRVLSAEGGLNT